MAGMIGRWGTCHIIGAPSRCRNRNFRPYQMNAIRCSSSNPNKVSSSTTPDLLKFVVIGLTEILRAFSPYNDRSALLNPERVRAAEDLNREEVSISGVDDVVDIIRSDYENAYFVTGAFSYSIYASDCTFEDPTIKFRGADLYYRNLKLLAPFFDEVSIDLQELEKGVDSGRNFVLAKWSLRTFLKLPWRPLIMIDGSTMYDLNDQFKIVRHSESWNVSAIEAIGQIFIPSSGNHGD